MFAGKLAAEVVACKAAGESTQGLKDVALDIVVAAAFVAGMVVTFVVAKTAVVMIAVAVAVAVAAGLTVVAVIGAVVATTDVCKECADFSLSWS